MIIHNLEQGTDEWFRLRLGIPTASRFRDIFTSTGKPASGSEGYMLSLIAESLAGKPLESYSNQWMQRGTELEPEARSYYELVKECEVTQTGFVTNDERTVGCSPDGFTPSGLLEIKCPKPETHVKYLLAKKVPAEYVPQVQGQLWICEADTLDFLSYHPDLPPLIVTVGRDDKFIEGLDKAITDFLEKMHDKLTKLEQAA